MINIGDEVTRLADCGAGVERIDRCKVVAIDKQWVKIRSVHTGFEYDLELAEVIAILENQLIDGGGE